jgi:hypothetical protein
VPSGLKRSHESAQSHFITFTCFHRFALLNDDAARRTFEIKSLRQGVSRPLIGEAERFWLTN